jgi:hypothetical protein
LRTCAMLVWRDASRAGEIHGRFYGAFDLPGRISLGASTATDQIEGSWKKNGKGENVWDRFSHRKYTTRNGDKGDDACDKLPADAERRVRERA